MITPVSGLARELGASTPSDLAKAYGPWVGIRSNHVVTQAGSFAGADGSSRSISTKEDRELLLALRSMADVITVDATTARAEQYKAPRSGAKLAIISRSGNFQGIPAVETSPEQVMLFSVKSTSAVASGRSTTSVRTSPDPLSDFMSAAPELGLRAILLEAGPTLTRLAFAAGLVSHSALTITPRVSNSDERGLSHPFDSKARLASHADTEGASFTYWLH